jgi:hypothetical protein
VRAPTGREFKQFHRSASEGSNANSRDDTRFRPGEKPDLARQRRGERIGERRQQDACVRRGFRDPHRPVQCNHCLAGSSRARDARGAGEVPLDDLTLGRMEVSAIRKFIELIEGGSKIWMIFCDAEFHRLTPFRFDAALSKKFDLVIYTRTCIPSRQL